MTLRSSATICRLYVAIRVPMPGRFAPRPPLAGDGAGLRSLVVVTEPPAPARRLCCLGWLSWLLSWVSRCSYLAGQEGLEPPTAGFGDRDSANSATALSCPSLP